MSYYFDGLSKPQKQVYHTILQCLQTLQPSVSVERLSNRELSDIYFKIRLDHPEIFYTVAFTYRYFEQADSVELKPDYLMKKKQIEEHRAALQARIEKLVRPVLNVSVEEKEKWVHDFICTNVRYDKLKKPYSHEIIGPLNLGVGVCEGIAKTVKVLCDRLGLRCIVALSEAAPEKGIKYRHAWNLLCLNGKWFHLDATFDNSLGEEAIRYDYFNLGDSAAFRDHEPALWPLPACTENGKSYYITNRLSFTKTEDLQKRLLQQAKKGNRFVFQWRGSYLTRAVLAQLLELCESAAAEFGKCASVRLNWPQSVLLVDFSVAQPATVFQQANEGEELQAARPET